MKLRWHIHQSMWYCEFVLHRFNPVADAGFLEGEFYNNIAHKACVKILEATPTSLTNTNLLTTTAKFVAPLQY